MQIGVTNGMHGILYRKGVDLRWNLNGLMKAQLIKRGIGGR